MLNFIALVLKYRKAFLLGALILGLSGAFGVVYLKARQKCMTEQRVESLEKTLKAVKEDAENWSNRPRTDDDTVKRLRDAANARRKSNP